MHKHTLAILPEFVPCPACHQPALLLPCLLLLHPAVFSAVLLGTAGICRFSPALFSQPATSHSFRLPASLLNPDTSRSSRSAAWPFRQTASPSPPWAVGRFFLFVSLKQHPGTSPRPPVRPRSLARMRLSAYALAAARGYAALVRNPEEVRDAQSRMSCSSFQKVWLRWFLRNARRGHALRYHSCYGIRC